MRIGRATGGGGGGRGGSQAAIDVGHEKTVFCTFGQSAAVAKAFGGDESRLQTAYAHPALRRQINFTCKHPGGAESDKTFSCQTCLGMELPILPQPVMKAYRGYVCTGAYLVGQGGVTNWWYGTGGMPLGTCTQTSVAPVELVVTYEPDYASMAGAPAPVSFVYAESNYVAFVPGVHVGCTYVDGTTNATDAGTYAYTVRLNEGMTIWSDLDTNELRTNTWTIAKAAITNDAGNVNMYYDWTKSREENEKDFLWEESSEFIQKKVLGFNLPKGTSAKLVLGRMSSEMTSDLEVRISGGKNYLDRTLYGTYIVPRMITPTVYSLYPWRREALFMAGPNQPLIESEWGIPVPDWMDKGGGFYVNYKDAEVKVCLLMRRGATPDEDVYAEKPLGTVDGLLSSSGGMLGECLDLEALRASVRVDPFRTGELPVFVSIDGIKCAATMICADLTAVERDGALHYAVHDDRDIYPFACGTRVEGITLGVVVDGVHVDKSYEVLVGIGCGSRPVELFPPCTTKERILMNEIVWQPTEAGEYAFEHVVRKAGEPDLTRKVVFDFCGRSPGEDPVTSVSRGIVAQVVHRSGRPTESFSSLGAAVAALGSGDTLRVLRDMQLDLTTVPAYAKIEVADTGVFRLPTPSDIPALHEAVVQENVGGKAIRVEYVLSERFGRPVLLGILRPEAGGDPVLAVSNVSSAVRYTLNGSADLLGWTAFGDAPCEEQGGVLYYRAPSFGESGFYKVVASDDLTPDFTLSQDGTTVLSAGGFLAGPMSGYLIVPASFEGIPVTAVGQEAFSGRDDLRAADLSPGIRTLGAGAFRDCANLVSVSLPQGLETISDGSLDGCPLEDLTIPASVTHIGGMNLPALKRLVFLGRPEQIAEDFRIPPDCRVIVPRDCGWSDVPGKWRGASIEYSVSYGTRENADGTLTITGTSDEVSGRLWLPEAIDGRPVTAIGREAFAGCSNLTGLVISEGIVSIGEKAFLDCPRLAEADIAGSVRTIGMNAFSLSSGELSGLKRLIFRGDMPSEFPDQGLDSSQCTIYVRGDAAGWDETWCGCPVAFWGADGQLYSPLAYVKATQGAYVDTLYRPNQNTRVTMDVTVRGEMEYWFGCWTNDYNRGAFCLGNDGVQGIYFAVCDDGGSFFHDGGRVPTGRHTVELTPWDFKVDGTIWAAKPESSRKDFRLDLSLYFFAQNRKGSAFVNAEQGTITCHGCTISENGSLKRKFVPCCRESDGAYGFYDAVGGVFYGNMGSGMFYGSPKDKMK